jgi:hypothetical protein
MQAGVNIAHSIHSHPLHGYDVLKEATEELYLPWFLIIVTLLLTTTYLVVLTDIS